MSNPVAGIMWVSYTSRGGQTYLRVQEPPGADLLTSIFPAQDTGELERQKHKVGSERGEYRGSGVHEMVNLTNISSQTPTRYGSI